MDYGPPPVPDSPPPVVQMLAATAGIYRRALPSLLIVGGTSSLVSNLLLTAWAPTGFQVFLLWLMVALVPTAVGAAAAMYIGRQVMRGNAPPVLAAYIHGIRYALPFVSGTLFIIFIFILLAPTLIGIPIAFFLAARLCLFGPMVLFDNLSLVAAARWSWLLVTNRTTNAVVLLFITALAGFLIMLVMQEIAGILDSTVVAFLLGSAALGAIYPFLAVLVLVMYDEYRRLDDEQGAPVVG